MMPEDLSDIDVYILCGGLGKRLRKISRSIPKPMVKIAGRPFLNFIIRYMAGFGFRRFILGVGYKGEMIERYYRNNKSAGVDIIFSKETKLLGTGGALKKARKLIKSRQFIVLNGDSFCRFNPVEFFKFHWQKKALASILLRRMPDGRDYGEVKVDSSRRILNFNEKSARAKRCLINAGVYLFDRRIFGLMPGLTEFSLERDLFPGIIRKKIFGYIYRGFFIDIGTPERYRKAQKYFKK